jgi:membrane associated rhomboid family serine protease
MRRVMRGVRARPTTVVLSLVVLGVGLALAPLDAAQHRDLVGQLGVTPAALRGLRLWTFIATPLVQADPGIRVRFTVQVLIVVGALAIAEPRLGSVPTALVFFGSELAVEPARLLTLWLMERLGSDAAAARLLVGDTGSSAAVFAVLGAFVTTLPDRWKWAGLAGLLLWAAGGLFYFPVEVGVEHAAGVLFGLLVGVALRRRRDRARPRA